MPQKMKYNGAWQAAKASGKLPSAPTDTITSDMSLKSILLSIEDKATAALASGGIAAKWGKNIDSIASRKFWLIPADETPSCELIGADDEEDTPVRHMAALKIPL
jgi:hypothetical protein